MLLLLLKNLICLKPTLTVEGRLADSNRPAELVSMRWIPPVVGGSIRTVVGVKVQA